MSDADSLQKPTPSVAPEGGALQERAVRQMAFAAAPTRDVATGAGRKKSVLKVAAETLSASLLAALGLASGFLAFVTWDQSHWWRTKEDYSFGWLVPAFAAFVVYDRWTRITAAAARCADPGSVRATGVAKWVLRAAVGFALCGGVLLFLLGAFYRAGAGASHPGTLAITLGASAIVLSLVFLNAPAAPASTGGKLLDDARVRLTALFLFPALVWLVSAPMVSVVESQLNLVLLRKVVTVVSLVFDVLGLPIEQQGNVLLLPTGRVGVEDACSGIRSLTACLFAGSFLAAVYLEQLWKKIALVGAAMGFGFLTNLARGLFLTAWAYRHGPSAIEGRVHDLAGYAVLGLTVLGLLSLLPLLNLRWSEPADAERTRVE
ncbi:MAG TPA: exosortase/archaeosortase family protein [Opitutus sp.]|nr:exosortase/archaeosortase family protein [Opitutus sp.]